MRAPIKYIILGAGPMTNVIGSALNDLYSPTLCEYMENESAATIITSSGTTTFQLTCGESYSDVIDVIEPKPWDRKFMPKRNFKNKKK